MHREISVVIATLVAHFAAAQLPVVDAPVPRSSAVVSVGDFFEDADGAPVSAFRAFQNALERAREVKAARLEIPPGRHVFSDPDLVMYRSHLRIAGLQDIVIEGNGAELVFTHPEVHGIAMTFCERVVLRNFTIEWDAPLASAGVVRRQPDGRTAIRILDDYPAGPATTFEAISEFDIAARRWKPSRNEVFHVANPEMIAPQTFVAPEFSRFAGGSEVIVRHRMYAGHAFGAYGEAVNHIALEDITVHSAPGMGFFFGSTGKGVRLTRCVIVPKAGRLISTNADGAHFTSTLGHTIVEECDFSGMGDDSLNISAAWLEAIAQPGPLTLDLGFAFRDVFYRDVVAPGMELSFRSRDTLGEYARRRVVAVTQDPAGRKYRVQLDAPIEISEKPGPVIGTSEMDSSVYLVRNNRFHDHRARGMLIQAPHGRIENNVVSNPTMSCLSITADARRFFEGFGASDLVVTGNRFEGCNFARERLGSGEVLAAVNVMAEVGPGLAPSPVHSGIMFLNNEIAGTPGTGILIAAAMELMLTDNVITGANADASAAADARLPSAPVVITRASHVKVSRLMVRSPGASAGRDVWVDAETTFDVIVPEPARRRSVGHR